MEDTKEVKQGFFTMDVIVEVCAQRSIEAAQKIAVDVVESKRKEATADNVRYALQVIEKAKTVKDLGITLTNFMFAHPSENLKVIR